MVVRRSVRRSAVAVAVAVSAVLGVAGCGDGGRSGALVGTTEPTVTCSVGVGGTLTLSNITTAISAVSVSWTYAADGAGNAPVDNFGFGGGTGANTAPPPTIQLASKPWAAALSPATPTITAGFVATNGSLATRTITCTKTGTDSPVPVISCTHTAIGSVNEHGTVDLTMSSVEVLGSSMKVVDTRWWWKGVAIWKVVLNPILSSIPDLWGDIAYKESKSFTLPGKAGATGHQTFESTYDQAIPSDMAGAYTGHVRLQIRDDRGRELSFPAEVDCK